MSSINKRSTRLVATFKNIFVVVLVNVYNLKRFNNILERPVVL